MRRSGLALLGLAMSLALPAPALADHSGALGGEWHFDQDFAVGCCAEGTPDSSGHSLHASAGGAITLDAGGRFGNHLSAGHHGVIRPAASSLLQPPHVTLVAWVRSRTQPGLLQYVAGQGDDADTCQGSSYALYTGFDAADGLRFYIRPAPPGNYVPSPVSGVGIWDGAWHMVAGVYDGSRVRLYVDGNERGSGTPSGGVPIHYGFPGNQFYMGSYPPICPGDGDFSGGIDEVRVYRRALSAAEIAELANPSAPTPPAVEDTPTAVLGQTVVARPTRGRVYVSVPGPAGRASRAGARAAYTPPIKGRRFVPLREVRELPVGSLVDTRAGSVRLRSARDTRGRTQVGVFSSGVFQVLQSRRRRARGLTEMRLKGGSFRRRCGITHARAGAGPQAARHRRRRLRRRTVRRLRGRARGRYRTRGRHSSATVRGTTWSVSDRCDGTLTRVRRGKVVVRDFRRKKRITLRRGKRYLARAR